MSSGPVTCSGGPETPRPESRERHRGVAVRTTTPAILALCGCLPKRINPFRFSAAGAPSASFFLLSFSFFSFCGFSCHDGDEIPRKYSGLEVTGEGGGDQNSKRLRSKGFHFAASTDFPLFLSRPIAYLPILRTLTSRSLPRYPAGNLVRSL